MKSFLNSNIMFLKKQQLLNNNNLRLEKDIINRLNKLARLTN